MNLTEIGEEDRVYPGEYVYHTPSQAIVLVGSFNRAKDSIKVMKHGRLMEDKISTFQKINLTRKEHKEYISERTGCSGCKGGR